MDKSIDENVAPPVEENDNYQSSTTAIGGSASTEAGNPSKHRFGMEVGSIEHKLCFLLSSKGFEVHPFKIGWYNECVDKRFMLPFDEDTLAFVIISTPHMFEDAFLPFLKQNQGHDLIRDPIDECVAHYIDAIPQAFPQFEVTVIKDFEMGANRRPKVLVQTAGHVSGAVRYYQKFDVQNPPWQENTKIHGVCIHPIYGGWFALRAVAIFGGALCPFLNRKPPPDPVETEEKRIELLEKFNFCWQDWSFRDVAHTNERYSRMQQIYFATKPSERLNLLPQLLSNI